MAGDQDDSQKTEEASEKKLEDARKKGEVARSQEMRHAVMLGAAAVVTGVAGIWTMARLGPLMTGLLGNAHNVNVGDSGSVQLAAQISWQVFIALSVPLGVLFIAAIGGGMLQGRPTLAWDKVAPKLSKISPLSGFKRLFGMSGWVEFAKSVAKMLIVGAVAFLVVWPHAVRLEEVLMSPPDDLVALIAGLTMRMLLAMAAIVIALALLDFIYQRFAFLKQQRMSRQDLKDEHKQSEGDPHIKARIRQIRMERSRRRMMAAVPTADVVITNPTHFAVALKYEQGQAGAPMVVAKGVDSLALRIRALAREHGVAIVENPPLARTLYASVEVEEEIRPEQYRAVAEVISYVMRLRRGSRAPYRPKADLN